MKKLALNLDALQVESFTTQSASAGRGTIHGNDDTVETENCTREATCLVRTCLSIKTCAADGEWAE